MRRCASWAGVRPRTRASEKSLRSYAPKGSAYAQEDGRPRGGDGGRDAPRSAAAPRLCSRPHRRLARTRSPATAGSTRGLVLGAHPWQRLRSRPGAVALATRDHRRRPDRRVGPRQAPQGRKGQLRLARPDPGDLKQKRACQRTTARSKRRSSSRSSRGGRARRRAGHGGSPAAAKAIVAFPEARARRSRAWAAPCDVMRTHVRSSIG
jgi:hypothetical protein